MIAELALAVQLTTVPPALIERAWSEAAAIAGNLEGLAIPVLWDPGLEELAYWMDGRVVLGLTPGTVASCPGFAREVLVHEFLHESWSRRPWWWRALRGFDEHGWIERAQRAAHPCWWE